MKGHAAVPQRDDLARVRRVMGQIVKEYVAEAAAADYADNGPEDEVPDGRRLERGLAVLPQLLPLQQRIAVDAAEEDPE
jgi:hypothetical protein